MSFMGHDGAARFDCCDDEGDDGRVGRRPLPLDHAIAHRRVRHTRVEGTTGATTVDTVFCPWRAETLNLGECRACERFRGIRPALDAERPDVVACCIPFPEPLSLDAAHSLVRERTVLLSVPVSAIVRDVVCLRGEVPAVDVARVLIQRGFSAVPIVDEDGRALGVVSKTDLVREREELAEATARDLMTPVVVSIPETASLGDAVELLATHGVHRVFVVSEDGGVTGVLSSMDIVRWLALTPGNHS